MVFSDHQPLASIYQEDILVDLHTFSLIFHYSPNFLFSSVFSLPWNLYCSFIFCFRPTYTIVSGLVSPHQNHRYIPTISVSPIIKVILFKSFPVMSGSRLIAFACFAFSLITYLTLVDIRCFEERTWNCFRLTS